MLFSFAKGLFSACAPLLPASSPQTRSGVAAVVCSHRADITFAGCHVTNQGGEKGKR